MSFILSFHFPREVIGQEVVCLQVSISHFSVCPATVQVGFSASQTNHGKAELEGTLLNHKICVVVQALFREKMTKGRSAQ